MVAYLWSKERGTLSHETALAIHDLSDVLPDRIHLTLPTEEKPVRRQVPDRLEIHFGEMPDDDVEFYAGRCWIRMNAHPRTAATVHVMARSYESRGNPRR